jgi:predicted amidohydrolase YtcJ
MRCDEEEIKDINALMTVIGGEIAYQKKLKQFLRKGEL